jgi:hypothetical protein
MVVFVMEQACDWLMIVFVAAVCTATFQRPAVYVTSIGLNGGGRGAGPGTALK